MSTIYILERVKSVKKPRKDWPKRWAAAGRAVKYKEVYFRRDKNGHLMSDMIASSDSPIWKELAKGTGGFRDAVGKGKPPFAYGSGLGWVRRALSREEGSEIVSAEQLAKEKGEEMVKPLVTKLRKELERNFKFTIRV